ncbi:MAG: 30S ribosomal protein S5 [Candidatus Campbellbacteria bacterium]
MTDEMLTKENEMDAADVATTVDAAPIAPEKTPVAGRDSFEGDRGGKGGRFEKNPRRRPRARTERVKPEFDQRIIGIRRVTRVVAGGRRFSFSVCVVAGNHRGQVGVGTGKAGDTALAVEKAYRSALKNKIDISKTDANSIPHEVQAKYSSGIVKLYPAPGRGLIAGGAVRDVLELAGMQGVGAKILSRSHNKLNNAFAAIKALEQLSREIRVKKSDVKKD